MKIMKTLRNESPTLLATAGVAGFISSVFMAVKVSRQANKILDDLEFDSMGTATKKDKVRAVAKIYAPTAGMMLLSTACIIGSNRIYKYRYASLLALYTISERSLQNWQEAVLEEVGRKKFEDVKEHILKPNEELPDIVFEDERTLFFDSYTGRYFRSSSIETVRKVVNDMNDTMYSEDFVALNDFYWGIGLSDVQFGNEVGWHISDGPITLSFDSYLKNDQPVVVVSFKGLKPRS